MDTEIWRDIPGYEGLYQCSDIGNIRSLDYLGHGTIRVLKLQKNSGGYDRVVLSSKNKVKSYLVHRLVALAFLEKIDGCAFINHIDGIKNNNVISNLEYVTHSQNMKHAYNTGLIKQKSTSITQYSLQGNEIANYDSFQSASRISLVGVSCIFYCVKGLRHTAGGYKWKYKNKFVPSDSRE